jgi:uncharacterized membrane protein HdeD (DUF308 family)
LVAPLVTSFTAVKLIGWFLLLAGIVHLFAGFEGKHTWGTAGRSLLFIAAGVLVLGRPVLAAVSLPVVLGLFLAIDGVIVMILSIANSKEIKGWGWVFFGGILSLVLGVLILNNPLLSLASMVLLVAISMIVSGLVMLVAPNPR